tara:strand:- start:634 stop:2592 length:1959 start_codon:yes stop_codon:yes gene_type:complete
VPTDSPDKSRLRRATNLAALAGFVLLGTILAMAGQQLVPFLGVVDRSLDDLKISLLTPAKPQRDDIAVLAITEDTLARFPYRSPLNRGFLAETLNKLAPKGVRAVVIDVLFDQATEPAMDDALKQAMESFPAPVIVSWSDERGGLTPAQQAFINDYLSGVHRGYANLIKDRDGIARKMFRGAAFNDAFVPGLPLAVARALSIPVQDGPLRIAYSRNSDPDKPTFRTFPIHTAGLLPPAWLADRVIFIGADLPQRDRHLTPFATAFGAGSGNLPGVVIHAHALAGLIDGRNLRPLSPAENVALIFVFALVGVVLAAVDTNVAVKFAVGGVAGVALLGLGVFGFIESGLLIPAFTPGVAMAAAAGFATAYVGSRDRAEKRFIRQAFSRYVSPAIVHQLVANPGRLQLGGQRREMTFMFTDIAGFTSLAEATEPSLLVTVLNEYLDAVSQIVLRHEGTIDKYVGDAVVAFFGAPLVQEDHCRRAIECATEIDAFSTRFRQEARAGGVKLGHTRIGVHSGEAIVGNFGGEARFDYTAIGDAVNTAARLEGANKYFGTHVCISGATVDHCPDLRVRPIGELVLKGKSKPIPAFTIVDGITDETEYRRAYDALRAGETTAPDIFATLARRYPDDPLIAYHQSRIEEGQRGVLIEMADK